MRWYNTMACPVLVHYITVLKPLSNKHNRLRSPNYRSTLSVLLPESGQPEAPPFDRDFLARELNVRESENSKKVPLLYTLLSNAQQSK